MNGVFTIHTYIYVLVSYKIINERKRTRKACCLYLTHPLGYDIAKEFPPFTRQCDTDDLSHSILTFSSHPLIHPFSSLIYHSILFCLLTVTRGRILGRNPDKSLSFPPCYFALRFLFLQTPATSNSFYSALPTIHCKGDRRKT